MKRAGLVTVLVACAAAQGCATEARSTSAAPGGTSSLTSSLPSSTPVQIPGVSSPVAGSVPQPSVVVTTTLPEPPVDDRVLEFTADLVGGGQFDGADYADRPVVLWFWGPV